MTDQNEQSAESSPTESPAIDKAALLNAASEADESGRWGNDGAFDPESFPKGEEVSPGNRAPDASGDVETKTEDKAEPSAEPQPKDHVGHPEGKKPTGKPVVDALGREHDPATGRLLPRKEAAEAKPAEVPKDKPETPYSKAKEAERQKSVLANFEKEKQEARAQIEAERRQLAAEKAEIDKFRQVPRAKDGSPHKFTSAQYSEAADDFYGRAKKALSEGDIDKSNDYLAQAEACSQSAEQVAQFEQSTQQQQGIKQYQAMWMQNREYAIQQNPELQDPENPVRKEVEQLFQDKEWKQVLLGIPNGYGVAAQIMKWKVAAVDSSALSEKLKKAEAERDEARARIGIRPASASGAMPKPTSFDDLSDDAKRRALKEAAFEEDHIPAFG